MHIQTNKRQSTKGDQIGPVIVYCLQIAEKVAYSQVKGEHVHDIWLVGARGQNVVFRATGSLYSLLNEPGKYRNDKGIIAQQVKQVKFPLHCLYCSIYFYRTTRDHKKTSPVEKNRKSSKLDAPSQDQEFLKSEGRRHLWDNPWSPPRAAMNPSMLQLIRRKAKYPTTQE